MISTRSRRFTYHSYLEKIVFFQWFHTQFHGISTTRLLPNQPLQQQIQNKWIRTQNAAIDQRKASSDPQSIKLWIMVALYNYRSVVADGRQAGCTINYPVHLKLWSCPGLDKVPSLNREQGTIDEFHQQALSPTCRILPTLLLLRHVVFWWLKAWLPIIPTGLGSFFPRTTCFKSRSRTTVDPQWTRQQVSTAC